MRAAQTSNTREQTKVRTGSAGKFYSVDCAHTEEDNADRSESVCEKEIQDEAWKEEPRLDSRCRGEGSSSGGSRGSGSGGGSRIHSHTSTSTTACASDRSASNAASTSSDRWSRDAGHMERGDMGAAP